ncbi:APC family permease [Streptomyces sp. NPDC127068]|uniref:APC family permease n=1 Tax=Streptomyces sp. NPDC127068 TaxID=3347127 RepID=UPI003661F8C8
MSAMDVPEDRPHGLTHEQRDEQQEQERAARAARGTANPTLTWVTLALMTTASVASLRAAPTMAVYGLACVFLYIVPAIVFLLPTSLVSAELASGWSGGVYRWVSEGLSKPLGFLAVWCQFAMTIFYYPSLLAFVASTIAYIIDPALAANGLYTAIVIMVLYWTGVWVSARGTGTLAGLSSWGLIIGTLVPGTLLVVLGLVFLGQGNPSAAPMDAANLLPQWAGLASLVLIVNNFLSYSGMEMNAVHVSSLKDPPREFPKTMFLAMGLVLLIFILPALAISWVVPADQLSLTAGVMQAFDAFFSYFHIGWLTPVAAVALIAASLGGMLAWLAGPSKGLLLISREEGYLPPFLQRLNKHGIQQNILVTQGVVTTAIALMYAFIPNVSSVYWIFSVITTQVYLIVYLLMFVAAVRLRRTQPDHPRGFRAPALPLLCGVGLLASLAALAIGFVPPSQFGGGSVWVYVGIVGGGLLVLGLVIPVAFLVFRRPGWRSTVPDAGSDAGSGEGRSAS